MPMADTLALLPQPQRLALDAGGHRPDPRRRIVVLGGDAGRAVQVIIETMAAIGGPTRAVDSRPDDPAKIGVLLRLDPAQVGRREGYRLVIGGDQIRLTARDAAGAFYGASTLAQVAAASRPGPLPCLRIEDWPDFPHRGVMLDVSRDRVPRMAYLYQLVDLLASLKINQLQLYTEHTFAYRNHRAVWADASPMTAGQVVELDAYCRARHVELVPNQNAFGHFERWLKHAAYRDLAECPEGFEMWGGHRGPTVLNPADPRCVRLLRELFDELLPNFTSGQFNIGCDETWELGRGRSKADCDQRGVGRVYLDFVQRVLGLVRPHGRTVQMWGDIILKHPELIGELPDDVIALAWGYEADHPFADQCRRFRESGAAFYVCPGTASWNSFIGRSDVARANLDLAAAQGLAHGAVGLLVTDWGDNGHHQPPAVSWPGYAFGAAVAWAYEANRALDLAAALDRHVFRDRAGVMGKAVLDLGATHRPLDWGGRNATWPSVVMRGFGELDRPAEKLEAARAAIDGAVDAMRAADMQREDGGQTVAELANAADFAQHACRLGIEANRAGGAIARMPADVRAQLAADLRGTIETFRGLWLQRSREGGLADSVAQFDRLLAKYGGPG